jgi:hypothetical protein
MSGDEWRELPIATVAGSEDGDDRAARKWGGGAARWSLKGDG